MKPSRLVIALLITTLLLTPHLLTLQPAIAAPPANEAFLATWTRTDLPVASGAVQRTWIWGPEALSGPVIETYLESPGQERVVQYFDKSRMELTYPDADPATTWYVTNGLLVVELITGNLQLGDNTFQQRDPAQVNVAGDLTDPDAPTYATFTKLLDAPPRAADATITERLARDGKTSEDPELAEREVTVAQVDEVTKHAIAQPFWGFMTSSGVISQDGGFVEAALFADPYFATGRPISEAYWVAVEVNDEERDVLVQCFERRCLTYTPDNPESWQVEAGNVGRHYWEWRTGDDANLARELAARPFAPLDPRLFHEGTGLPGAWTRAELNSDATLAPERDRSPAALEAELRLVLRGRFGDGSGGRQQVEAAMEIYDAPLPENLSFDPTLRAAAVALYGTVGAAALEIVHGGMIGRMQFCTLPDEYLAGFNYIVTPAIAVDGKPLGSICVNDRLANEDLRLLGLLVLHETLHHEYPPPASPADPGTENSLSEETFNTFASSLIYAQFLAEGPDLARQTTHLTIVQNTYLLALLNTVPARDPGGIGPLNSASTASIFPGGANYPDFASFVRSRYESNWPDMEEDSPGSPYLRTLVETFTGATPADDASFADALASVEHATVSRDVIDAPGLLTVVAALSLDVAGETTASPALAIRTRISPTSRWCASMEAIAQQLAAARS